jgi:membrane protease YdiL (CAAX protease family)
MITFLITWTLWFGDAILVKLTPLKESDFIPMILFTIGGFGPTIAALFCLEEKLTTKSISKFIFRSNKKSLLLLILFIGLETMTFGLSSMELNKAISVSSIPMIVLLAIFIYGGNEELGWRGIMQPIIQKSLPYPLATFIVGAVWSVWHIPLWFIEGNSHQGSSFFVFAVLAIFLSYWLSTIINFCGSIFYCMILHSVTNTLLSIFVIKVNWIFITGLILLTTLAIFISIVSKNSEKANNIRKKCNNRNSI